MIFMSIIVGVILLMLLLAFEVETGRVQTKLYADYRETNKYSEKSYSEKEKLDELFESTGNKTHKTVFKGFEFDSDNLWDYDPTFKGVVLIIGIITLVISLVVIACVQIGAESRYLQYQAEREILIAQYERLEEATDNPNLVISGDMGSLSSVYHDIAEYNKRIIVSEYWSDNLWFGWFFNGRYKDLEPIELD